MLRETTVIALNVELMKTKKKKNQNESQQRKTLDIWTNPYRTRKYVCVSYKRKQIVDKMQIVVAAFFQFIFKMHQAEQNVHSAFDFLPPTPKNGGIFCFIFYHFSLIRLSEDKRNKN